MRSIQLRRAVPRGPTSTLERHAGSREAPSGGVYTSSTDSINARQHGAPSTETSATRRRLTVLYIAIAFFDPILGSSSRRLGN